MRRLWIKRRKAAAAGLAKMKVYMEDPENGDIEIDGTLCRKLGEIGSGQQKHFDIGQEPAKVFVAAGKISRKREYEFVQIPEGRADVFLSGKNYLKPLSGNPFRFDDTQDDQIRIGRNRGSRVGAVILVIAILLGVLAGVFGGRAISGMFLSGEPKTAAEKTFACQGMEITLTDKFSEEESAGYTACYSSGDTAVFVLREDFGAREGFGDLTVAEYGALVLESNGLEGTVTLEEADGLTTFGYEFTNVNSGDTYYYYTVLLKGPDAFWMVQITTLAQNVQEYIPQFRQWAQSIGFNA